MTFHLLGSELFPCLDKKFKVQEIPKRRCLRLRPKKAPSRCPSDGKRRDITASEKHFLSAPELKLQDTEAISQVNQIGLCHSSHKSLLRQNRTRGIVPKAAILLTRKFALNELVNLCLPCRRYLDQAILWRFSAPHLWQLCAGRGDLEPLLETVPETNKNDSQGPYP